MSYQVTAFPIECRCMLVGQIVKTPNNTGLQGHLMGRFAYWNVWNQYTVAIGPSFFDPFGRAELMLWVDPDRYCFCRRTVGTLFCDEAYRVVTWSCKLYDGMLLCG